MCRILLIEDDETVRALIVRILGAHEVIQACDGEDGLQRYHEHQPDLVLTDIQMPRMDGLQVIRELRQCVPDIKVIVMTGAFEHFKDALEELNVSAVLRKPFTVQMCNDIVDQCVPLSR